MKTLILALSLFCLSVSQAYAQASRRSPSAGGVGLTVVHGKLLGGDGKPMERAFVALSRGYNYARTETVAEVGANGEYKLTTDKPGIYLLLYTGVNHLAQTVPIVIDKPRTLAIDVRLHVPEYKEDLSEARIGRDVGFNRQPDGTYVAEMRSDKATETYAIGRAFKIRGAIQGTAPGSYKLDRSGVLIFKEATPVDGKIRIVLDPTKLPRPSGPPEVRFRVRNSADERLFSIYKEIQGRNSQEFQPKQRTTTDEEINHIVTRARKERHPLLKNALWLSFLDLSIYAQQPHATYTAEALDALASTPGLWILSFADLPKAAVTAAGQPDKYADYLEAVLRAMPPDDWVGRPVPAFSIAAANNPAEIYTNKNSKARVYLFDFWATWCVPCISQMPYLHRAYEKYSARGFEIISYSVDKSWDVVEKFRKQKGMSMPWVHGYDPKFQELRGEVPSQFKVRELPSAFLVDSKGVVIATHYDLEGENLEKVLARVLLAGQR
ncbi:MAG: redoxin family protein [Pyrinomonadaceae bacterium]